MSMGDDGEIALETPGAGPSRLRQENVDRELFSKRRQQYVELQQNIESSTELLASLASYLSTFQTDLSAVSGQVADLQKRSADIESELTGRKDMLPTINSLLSDITLPPSLVLTLRDTQPYQNPDLWLAAIIQLDEKIITCRALSTPSDHDKPDRPDLRSSRQGSQSDVFSPPPTPGLTRPSVAVQAASEMSQVTDGLRLRALHLLPPFLLSLIKPLRSASKGLSTNLAVLQTSLLLKYQPFYAFVLGQSPRLAKQIERGYVTAARSYYETAFRRYTRALALVKARGPVPPNAGGAGGNGTAAPTPTPVVDKEMEGLKYVLEDGGDVVLIFQADDKDFHLPIEGLFRSMTLVLLDNASAEFTFLVRFFARARLSVSETKSHGHAHTRKASHISEPPSSSASALGTPDMPDTPTRRTGSTLLGITPATFTSTSTSTSTDLHLKEAERLWHEVFDTALESCDAFFNSIIITPPPALSLLALIRLNDRTLAIAEHRGALPLVAYLQKQRLALWPLFRKDIDARIDALKRLADDAEGKGFTGLMRGVKDATVGEAGTRYAKLYSALVALADEADEQMVFGSMIRMRTELVRLIVNQSTKVKSPTDRQSFLSVMYDGVMRDLIAGIGPTTHVKMQSEMSFFRTREEEARRRVG